MKSNYTTENIFTDVKFNKFPRHKFNKSYFSKLTLNHGYAVPFFVDDVLPGDRFDLKTFGRIQLQPLATSSMQNIRCYFRYFYVPYRLVWENWDKFMTQDPNSEVAILAPYTQMNNVQMSVMSDKPWSLADYLGVGLTPKKRYSDPNTKLQFNLFRFAAYYLIWNEYFRDENLQSLAGLHPSGEYLIDGYQPYDTHWLHMLPISYEKDYFTTALPWPQKGEPVNLNAYVQTYKFSAPVSDATVTFGSSDSLVYGNVVTNTQVQNVGLRVSSSAPVGSPLESSVSGQEAFITIPDNTLSTSININDLRYSNALQRYLERKALGGSRPAEFYLSMYGVRVDDLRIGRPFYLGGGHSNVTITDVASSIHTTDNDGNDIPQGSLAGNGKTFPAMSINHPYYCQEAGVVMGIMYLRPEINYMQGLPKQMQIFRTLDYYNPIFANLGEEAVMKSELVIFDGLDNTTSENNTDTVFGYQSRYAYLKHRRNEIHGDFKTSLSKWMLAPVLPDNVELNDDFISVQQDYSIFAVEDPDQHHYLCELFNDYQVESNMPDFSIPSL